MKRIRNEAHDSQSRQLCRETSIDQYFEMVKEQIAAAELAMCMSQARSESSSAQCA